MCSSDLGVDVWLNTPLRPNEASGTSGMKALVNGVLNLSTLDGWWDEAYRSCDSEGDGPRIGWAIGNGEDYADAGYQDQVEAAALYDILERDVIPVFYDRRSDGLPYRWISMIKASVGNLCRFFNTHRMVREYAEHFYLNADAGSRRLAADAGARVVALSAALGRIQKAWPEVEAEIIDSGLPTEIRSGDAVRFQALIRPGALSRDDLRVELYSGRLNADGEIEDPAIVPMAPVSEKDGGYVCETIATPSYGSGRHGCTVRVLPQHPDLADKFAPQLIRWAE